MADKTCPVGDEKLVSMKDYVDMRFAEVEKARRDALAAMETRLAAMNEFRDTLRDQAGKFVTREELETELRVIEADIRILRDSKNLLEGKASQSALNLTLGLAFLGILLSIVALLLDVFK